MLEVRPEVAAVTTAMAQRMEEVLRSHDDRPGWKDVGALGRAFGVEHHLIMRIVKEASDMAEQPTEEQQAFEMWAVVELLGHRRLAGRLTEQQVAGQVLLRVDVPALDGSMTTQLYGGQAIYCLTPTTEEVARALALRLQPEPVHRYELPVLAQAARPTNPPMADDDEEHDDARNYL